MGVKELTTGREINQSVKVNVSNERSRVNGDSVMLMLLISSAVLTVHHWVMERESEVAAK